MASVKSKFLGYVLDELGTGAVEFCRKGARRRKVVGVIRSLNAQIRELCRMTKGVNERPY